MIDRNAEQPRRATMLARGGLFVDANKLHFRARARRAVHARSIPIGCTHEDHCQRATQPSLEKVRIYILGTYRGGCGILRGMSQDGSKTDRSDYVPGDDRANTGASGKLELREKIRRAAVGVLVVVLRRLLGGGQ